MVKCPMKTLTINFQTFLLKMPPFVISNIGRLAFKKDGSVDGRFQAGRWLKDHNIDFNSIKRIHFISKQELLNIGAAIDEKIEMFYIDILPQEIKDRISNQKSANISSPFTKNIRPNIHSNTNATQINLDFIIQNEGDIPQKTKERAANESSNYINKRNANLPADDPSKVASTEEEAPTHQKVEIQKVKPAGKYLFIPAPIIDDDIEEIAVKEELNSIPVFLNTV
ncbi:hypothetical protein TRFO_28754 [Tritrichomonas foetus]|uniref:Uncharacterized protein n=1 Tax=Tritrichomonas foetus TaxID=1144522 RepID=A0A1J4K2D3_9EUKA|nr:hypothetical protein TRFO_28754 [Tritrichomonas foetus]|eukprot:OHT03908.1 hypothetical protein TRFO_28754 [Tritrichomonas foetus]